MTTALEAPTAGRGPAPATSSTRWTGGPAVLAGLLVLVGVVWSFVLWAPATASLSAGTTTSTGSASVVTVPEYGARGTHVVDYRHGADVELVVPLRNDGPLPVRVVAVGTEAGRLPLLDLRGVDLPLTVAPGRTADVVLRGRLGNCAYYHERSVQNVEDLAVEIEVLGSAATRRVPLDRPLLVPSPMIVSCPDRTLTRNDDRRTPSGSRL